VLSGPPFWATGAGCRFMFVSASDTREQKWQGTPCNYCGAGCMHLLSPSGMQFVVDSCGKCMQHLHLQGCAVMLFRAVAGACNICICRGVQ
jgi:hypothetical protein